MHDVDLAPPKALRDKSFQCVLPNKQLLCIAGSAPGGLHPLHDGLV